MLILTCAAVCTRAHISGSLPTLEHLWPGAAVVTRAVTPAGVQDFLLFLNFPSRGFHRSAGALRTYSPHSVLLSIPIKEIRTEFVHPEFYKEDTEGQPRLLL